MKYKELRKIIKEEIEKKDPHYVIGYMKGSIKFAIDMLQDGNPDAVLEDLKKVMEDLNKWGV